MARAAKLRISLVCEAGVRTEADGRQINYHRACSGMEDRRVGRNYRCQCACHKKAKAT